ncbi:hypothetical protein KUCAC02_005124 [Chaenocephalus aceratus]|uniref:Uncharacterized protein n=1 Tax=Chaenocephalus aceratus TaxID=36190 RepID=A0ACB9WP43_CHAAC|nr:hypothetical protein KUCAC02_005124 [Chaenocephalus aceratus]
MFASRAARGRVNGTTAIPWRSSRRKPSLLEQLKGSECAWCPAAPWERDGARAALCGTPAGIVSLSSHCFSVYRLVAVWSFQYEHLKENVFLLSASHTEMRGDNNEAVIDYCIKSTDTVFQLSESRLCFSDLAQLVLFYSLTRDVLALCLSIPLWIYGVTEKTGDLSQLEPETWLCSPTDQQTDEMTQREPSNLTSTNGALCIINPLYLREHGDDWLTNRTTAAESATPSPTNYRKERRLSTTRAWAGAGLLSKRAISMEQDSAAITETSGLSRASSADSPHCPTSAPETSAGVVLRRLSRDAASSPAPYRVSSGSLTTSTPSTPGGSNRESLELPPHGSPVPLSPHRVSWVEDGVWLPPPRPSSRLHPPSLELDSLSISSIEEEQEYPIPSPAPHHQSAHRLADKVIHRLSAVGQALGGLVSQKKRLTNRVQELSERKGSAFAEAVKGFVEMTLKKAGDHDGVTGSEFLQEVRSSLSALRETLLDYPDILALLDSITDLNDSEIDSLVELCLHKVALKPVSAHLYSCIHASRTNDGSFDRLQSNMSILEKNGVEELGGLRASGFPTLSPWRGSSRGTAFGADDFLPCLTWVLLRSDVVTLHLDTDYMMELLDPTQLQGEGGYYPYNSLRLSLLHQQLQASIGRPSAERRSAKLSQPMASQAHAPLQPIAAQQEPTDHSQAVVSGPRVAETLTRTLRAERREVQETGSLLVITSRRTGPEALQPLDEEAHTPSDGNQGEEVTSKREEDAELCVEKRTTDDCNLEI